MKNRWNVTEEIRNRYLPILKDFLNKMENITKEDMEFAKEEDFYLDFSDTEINPYQLWKLLEELEYDNMDMDRNGWEMDFWIDMERNDLQKFPSGCEHLVICGCGITFELKLAVKNDFT